MKASAGGLGSGIRNVVKHFTDLEAWKIAHELELHIYQCTQLFPESEKFGLISQMRRSATSVTSNIAEGFGRYHPNDKKSYYLIARASAYELESQIYTSKDLGFLSVKQYKNPLMA